MSGATRTDLGALSEQARALRSFRESADEAMRIAQTAMRTTCDGIQDELGRRRQEVQRAEQALIECSAQERRDCSAQAQALDEALRQAAAAERALQRAQRAGAAFQGPKERFLREVREVEGSGARALATLAGDVEAYLAGASSGTGGSGAGRSGTPASSGLPAGYQMVALDSIDDGDSQVTGSESFGKGYSPDDLRWAFSALHEVVLPALAAGKGADYFAARDQAEGRMGTRSYSDTYSGFFGDSAIKLEPRGDGSYGVGNGYHRIWVAKGLGLSAVPGRVR